MIEFPGLWGLKFVINPVAISFGQISIYWYGITIAAAFLLAVLLGMKNSAKYGIDPEKIIDLVLIGAPVSIIFAI
jgi:phosphatidylglycerol:prolipoprotein diacylglycerol transferase